MGLEKLRSFRELGFFLKPVEAMTRSRSEGIRPDSHGSGEYMRRVAIRAALPGSIVAGVALWFVLVPGRSGAE